MERGWGGRVIYVCCGLLIFIVIFYILMSLQIFIIHFSLSLCYPYIIVPLYTPYNVTFHVAAVILLLARLDIKMYIKPLSLSIYIHVIYICMYTLCM